jgi:hypothetical protein
MSETGIGAQIERPGQGSRPMQSSILSPMRSVVVSIGNREEAEETHVGWRSVVVAGGKVMFLLIIEREQPNQEPSLFICE